MRPSIIFCGAFALLSLILASEVPVRAEEAPKLLDLPTVLRLAGARSIDVEIARAEQRIAEAEVSRVHTRFFPWLTTGASYRRHDGSLADVQGDILPDVDKQQWDAGGIVHAQVDLGDALFASRAARRTADAAGHALDAERQDALLTAALEYFDLLAAAARIEVFTEAERISADYETQVSRAVDVGLSSRSEQLRARVETEKNRLEVERAQEQGQAASARLAETLRLGATPLVAQRADLAPVSLVAADKPVDALVATALAGRAEIGRSEALVAAAREAKNGAVYGPLIPSIGGEIGFGGTGGGPDSGNHSSGGYSDYLAGLHWRLGPGGLLDWSRIDSAAAELHRSELEEERLRDRITREVVEGHARSVVLARRLETSKGALETARQSLSLSRQRREFGVDVVLENIQAEQEQTRANADYLLTVIDWNRVQYSLLRALGGSPPP
ncbi:MAG TPA: TolC family protein [Candidatus Binatia bacterium]|jgi:outer membrane protein TolC